MEVDNENSGRAEKVPVCTMGDNSAFVLLSRPTKRQSELVCRMGQSNQSSMFSGHSCTKGQLSSFSKSATHLKMQERYQLSLARMITLN